MTTSILGAMGIPSAVVERPTSSGATVPFPIQRTSHRVRSLTATDAAARGVHVDDVAGVVLDPPTRQGHRSPEEVAVHAI
jgi:hypothetical protein